MQPLLKIIAKEYSQRYPDLKQICFLFPNKRCGVFLKKYLVEYGRTGDEMPHILTITEFLSQIARNTEASKVVQLFTLFNAYKEIIGDGVPLDFDTFRSWGETVISDFNTVDMALADPYEVFRNVKDYRAITSNFLTEEQKEVMKEYFGMDDFGDSSGFWKNFSDPEKITPLKQSFLNLWQVLSPLHENFVKKLSKDGYGTTGSLYRNAAERILSKGRDVFPYKKIVAVGFNALTESERVIFKEMREMEGFPGFDAFADFIWDATGPILTSEEFSASKFVAYNKKHFPMPEWLIPTLENEDVYDYPDITIVSSPSLTAQAKVTGEILTDYSGPEVKKMITDAEVVVVLPDETLLTNTLYSIPQNIGAINLTMGYSLKQTPVSAFMSLLRRVYATTRESKDGNVFYVRDFRMLLSHPYSSIIFESSEVEALQEYLDYYHKVSVNMTEVVEKIPEASEYLNLPSKQKGNDDIFIFLENLFQRLIHRLSVNEATKENESDSDNKSINMGATDEDEGLKGNEDIAQVTIYAEYVKALEEAVKKYGIETSPLSVMVMADRLVSSEKIGFEGELLSGLQVMGTLETRGLDFRHVIIMSMNEGKMPRRSFTSTFIPETLRKAYGLPPSRYAEEIFGYYFYRLISRAEKVTLIYDGRVITGMKGGISRYLLQLRHFAPKDKVKEVNWQYTLKNRESNDASITKTPKMLELTEAFSSEGDNRKNFSASSLNTYRECQVKFYLQSLLNINSDPEKGEFMDSIEIGDVLHNVMMELYLPDKLQRKLLKNPVTISKEFLEDILSHSSKIRDLVQKNINIVYYNEKHDSGKEIESGVTGIISDQITELVEAIVNYDLTLTPFNLYGSEISEKLRVKLKSGRIVNFRFAIDRLDEIEVQGVKHLRIVDYKTGSRKRKADSVEEMFCGGYNCEQVFQLFVYGWLLGKLGVKGWEDVITEIYFVPDLLKGERGLPEIDGKEVENFRPYVEEFGDRLEEMIESVFTSPVFKENPSCRFCTYCAFRSFCSK